MFTESANQNHMGIKSFFKKIGNGIKKAGRFVRDKVLPVVGRIAKPVLNVLGALPGHIGMVGKLGSAITGVIHQATDKIPNEQIRDKINSVVDKGEQGFKKIVDTGQNYAERANEAVNRGREIVNTVKRGYDTQVQPLIRDARYRPKLDWSKIGPKVM